MRILHVITRLVAGGARRVVEEIVRGLDAVEFQQMVASGPDDVKPREVEGSLGAPIAWVPHLQREIRPASDGRAAVELAGIIRRYRPKVVHAHTYKAGVIGCWVARAMGVPHIVFSPHGHIFAPGALIPGVPRRPLTLGILATFQRLAMRSAHVVTLLAPQDLRDQVRLGLAVPRTARVIENGVRIDEAPPDSWGQMRARLGLQDARPLFGTVGRLSDEKGHDLLLEAFAAVRRQRPQAGLVLVGDGPALDRLRSRARELGIAGSVVFTGYHGDPRPLLWTFDVYVQPSRYEGLGIAVLEAMAAARPVIATRAGGVTDLVEDGRTGRLVPRGDPNALAAAMLELTARPEEAAEMGRCGRQRVRERFGVERMVAAYREVYTCSTT